MYGVYNTPSCSCGTPDGRPVWHAALRMERGSYCVCTHMLSPLGSEVMISCHVAFFRVICYISALQIKMTTTAPPGHVHEDFLTVIDEVKPAPVDKRKIVLLHYIGRSLRTCLLVLLSSHCLSLSRSKHDSGGHTLSLLTAGHRSSRILSAGEGEKVQRSRGRPRRRILPTAGRVLISLPCRSLPSTAGEGGPPAPSSLLS